MTWTFSRPKTSKYLPTCCENRAASRYLSRMTFWFLNGPVRHVLCSPESRAALKLRMCSTLQNTRSLCSAYIFHRIAQRNDNLRVRVESLNFLGGISGAKIRSRSFSYSFLILSSGKTAQIIRQSLNSSLIAKNIGREKLGFFDPRHENLGMILEVGVEGSRPALWPANYKEIRFGHCAFHLSSLALRVATLCNRESSVQRNL